MMMNRTYSPVALVVDDDLYAARRVHRMFLTHTSLGVLEARDLRTASQYLHDPSLKIDVLVTDVNFTENTRCRERNLADGLDLVEEVSRVRPELESYVLSVDAQDTPNWERAKNNGLKIAEWFSKLGSVGDSSQLPWAKVERACLVKALKQGTEFRERARNVGIDVRELASDEAIAEKVRKALILPRLTYLNEFTDELNKDYKVVRPIEVLCVQETETAYRASAPQIGLIADATGSSVEDALENLANLIVDEARSLAMENSEPVGYAAHVKVMLEKYVLPN